MIILGIFFISATFGLAIYSSAMRDFIGEFIDIEKSKVNFTIASTVPFFIICVVSTFIPSIVDLFDFFTYTVYNFNGYILPFMMAIVTYLRYIKTGP